MPENSNAPRMTDVPRNLKPYFLCLLRKGPHWDVPQGHEDLMPLQLAFLRQQIEAGRFLLSGPVLGHAQDPSDDVTGITILRAENLDEAQALAAEDPAVQAGRLIAEVRPVFLPSLDNVRVEY
ncbi:MAG: YciI family protein [Silvibacterium sp.]